PQSDVDRVFTSKKTRAPRSSATRSSSPIGQRTLRSRIRYPRRRNARTAASSPIAPSCLRLTTPKLYGDSGKVALAQPGHSGLHARLCSYRFQTKPLSVTARDQTAVDPIRTGAGGGAAERLEASRRRR